MKKIFSILAALFILSLVGGCRKVAEPTMEELLIGSWKADLVHCELVEDGTPKEYDYKWGESGDELVWVFDADGTFSVKTSSYGFSDQWSISENKVFLSRISEQPLTIEELTRTALVISLDWAVSGLDIKVRINFDRIVNLSE